MKRLRELLITVGQQARLVFQRTRKLTIRLLIASFRGLSRLALLGKSQLNRLSGRLNRFSRKTEAFLQDGYRNTGAALRGISTRETTPQPSTIQRLYKKRITQVPEGECVYAIGDIHGRFDLLEKLIDQIDSDASNLPSDTRITIVFLGDYIDRGMQSRQVIDFFMSERLAKFETVFLMGNHEEALLNFRSDPSFGPIWARYGGVETLYSYGLQPPMAQGPLGRGNDSETWQKTWDEFRRKLPNQHLDFFQSLKHYFHLGDYVFVHAGLRPNLPLEEQTTRDMLWIRDEFLRDEAPFEHYVVHGHTPSDEVVKDHRRIGLDTGAYYSGQLSAAKFYGTKIAVLST